MACRSLSPIGAELPPGSGYLGWLSQRRKGRQSGQAQHCATGAACVAAMASHEMKAFSQPLHFLYRYLFRAWIDQHI
jgi:hypothetical protein